MSNAIKPVIYIQKNKQQNLYHKLQSLTVVPVMLWFHCPQLCQLALLTTVLLCLLTLGGTLQRRLNGTFCWMT